MLKPIHWGRISQTFCMYWYVNNYLTQMLFMLNIADVHILEHCPSQVCSISCYCVHQYWGLVHTLLICFSTWTGFYMNLSCLLPIWYIHHCSVILTQITISNKSVLIDERILNICLEIFPRCISLIYPYFFLTQWLSINTYFQNSLHPFLNVILTMKLWNSKLWSLRSWIQQLCVNVWFCYLTIINKTPISCMTLLDPWILLSFMV